MAVGMNIAAEKIFEQLTCWWAIVYANGIFTVQLRLGADVMCGQC